MSDPQNIPSSSEIPSNDEAPQLPKNFPSIFPPEVATADIRSEKIHFERWADRIPYEESNLGMGLSRDGLVATIGSSESPAGTSLGLGVWDKETETFKPLQMSLPNGTQSSIEGDLIVHLDAADVGKNLQFFVAKSGNDPKLVRGTSVYIGEGDIPKMLTKAGDEYKDTAVILGENPGQDDTRLVEPIKNHFGFDPDYTLTVTDAYYGDYVARGDLRESTEPILANATDTGKPIEVRVIDDALKGERFCG